MSPKRPLRAAKQRLQPIGAEDDNDAALGLQDRGGGAEPWVEARAGEDMGRGARGASGETCLPPVVERRVHDDSIGEGAAEAGGGALGFRRRRCLRQRWIRGARKTRWQAAPARRGRRRWLPRRARPERPRAAAQRAAMAMPATPTPAPRSTTVPANCGCDGRGQEARPRGPNGGGRSRLHRLDLAAEKGIDGRAGRRPPSFVRLFQFVADAGIDEETPGGGEIVGRDHHAARQHEKRTLDARSCSGPQQTARCPLRAAAPRRTRSAPNRWSATVLPWRSACQPRPPVHGYDVGAWRHNRTALPLSRRPRRP